MKEKASLGSAKTNGSLKMAERKSKIDCTRFDSQYKINGSLYRERESSQKNVRVEKRRWVAKKA